MASTFKMEPMTYRVGPTYFNSGIRQNMADTFDVKVKKKGYESATAVYGPKYMSKPQRGGKPKEKQDLIGYDAVAMTRVEYIQEPQVQVQQVQPQQIAKAAPKVEVPGTGANRGAVGSLGASSKAGIAGNAVAGLVGSVNTEVQNDDNLLPYQKV